MDKQTIALQIFKEYWNVFSIEFSLQGKNTYITYGVLL